MREVGVATLAGTLATIIVFVPLVFGSPSEITILMKHVAIPIVIAMVASLLVAQTIIPMLSARITAPLGDRPRLVRRPPAGPLRCGPALGAGAILRKTGLALLVILASPVALFATKALKVDPFPQDAGRGLFLDYHIKGTHPWRRSSRPSTASKRSWRPTASASTSRACTRATTRRARRRCCG